MNVNSDNGSDNLPSKGEDDKLRNKSSIFDHAPLAAPEDDSDDQVEAGYAQVKDGYGEDVGNEQMYTFPHDTTPNKSKLRHRREKGQQSLYFHFNCFSLMHLYINIKIIMKINIWNQNKKYIVSKNDVA